MDRTITLTFSMQAMKKLILTKNQALITFNLLSLSDGLLYSHNYTSVYSINGCLRLSPIPRLKSSSRESVVQSARNFKPPLHQAPPQPPPLHQEVREKPRAPPPQSPLLHQEVLEKPRVLPHQLSHPQLPQLHQVVKVASEF